MAVDAPLVRTVSSVIPGSTQKKKKNNNKSNEKELSEDSSFLNSFNDNATGQPAPGHFDAKKSCLATALFHAWYYLFFYFWFLYRTPNSLFTQDSQFAFRFLFFVEDLEVRVDLTDAHVTSLVVLQNFEELTGQHDDYEQIYVGR